MCVHRDDANIAMVLPLRAVIAGNAEQSCIFALRARVRLHGNRIVTRHIAKFRRKILDHLIVACRLIFGDIRVEQREFIPADRHHFGGGVEFHRA